MKEILTAIVASIAKMIDDVLSAKVLVAAGGFLALVAAKQYTEAAGIVITFLGVGGAREVVKTISAAKTETAVANATTAVAGAQPAAAVAASDVATTLTPDETVDDPDADAATAED